MPKLSLLTGDVVCYYSPFSFNPFKERSWGNHAGVIIDNYGALAVNEVVGNTVTVSPISSLEGLECIILRNNTLMTRVGQLKFACKANAMWGCGPTLFEDRSEDMDVGYVAACHNINFVAQIEDLLTFPDFNIIYKGNFSVELLRKYETTVIDASVSKSIGVN